MSHAFLFHKGKGETEKQNNRETENFLTEFEKLIIFIVCFWFINIITFLFPFAQNFVAFPCEI